MDQMLLRYRRDIDRLDVNVHVMAAIDNDFVRMLSKSFLGYGRPVLALHGGDLVIANFPVPKGDWTARLESTGRLLGDLRSVGLLDDLLSRVVFKRAAGQNEYEANYDILGRLTADQRRVILAIFESLRDLNRSRGRRFVFVRLPTEPDCYDLETSRPWRNWVTGELGKLGIPVIDLLPDFSALPAVDSHRMFIQKDVPNSPAAKGHYTEAGNKFVAERVYDRLTSLRELPAKPAGSI